MKTYFYLIICAGLSLQVCQVRAQAQSNIGFSQQVQPKKAEAPDDAAQTTLKERKAEEATFLKEKSKARFQGLRAIVDKTVVMKYGVLADGDFSQATGKDGKAPTTGSIGFNILRLRPVTYKKVYDYSKTGSEDALQKAIDTRKEEADKAQRAVNSLEQRAKNAEKVSLRLQKRANRAKTENVPSLLRERADNARTVAEKATNDYKAAQASAMEAQQLVSEAKKAAHDDAATKYLTADEVLEPSLSLNAVVSFGPRQDTLRVKPDPANPTGRCLNQYDFGQSLLLPGSAAVSGWRSGSLSARWFPASWWVNYPALRSLGLGGDIGIATTRWEANKRTSDINLTSGSAGLYYTLANTIAHDADDFALRLDVFGRYTFRQLSGDIREENDIVTRALNVTDQYFFNGYELGAQASLNALRLTVTWSRFGGHIKGFSNGQFVIGIGFSNAFRFNKTEKLTGGIVHQKG